MGSRGRVATPHFVAHGEARSQPACLGSPIARASFEGLSLEVFDGARRSCVWGANRALCEIRIRTRVSPSAGRRLLSRRDRWSVVCLFFGAVTHVPTARNSEGSPAMKEKVEDHAITFRDVILPDGTHARALRVFCPRKSQSVSVEVCRACPRMVAVCEEETGASPCVRCSPGAAHSPSPADVSVGAMLSGRVAAVAADVPEHAIRALFVKHSLALIAVVDEAHRVVGVVREADLIHRGLVSADVVECAAEIMTPAFSIPEGMPVRTALLEMAMSRVRHAPVVTPEGELLGTLIDVIGLKWLRGERPET